MMQGLLNSPTKGEAILGAPATMAGPPRRHSWTMLTRMTRVLSLLRTLSIALIFVGLVLYCVPDRSLYESEIESTAPAPPMPPIEAPDSQSADVQEPRQQIPVHETLDTHQSHVEQPAALASPAKDSPTEQVHVPHVHSHSHLHANAPTVKQPSVQQIPDIEEAAPPESPPVTPIKGGKAAWQDYSFLQRYFGGLRTVADQPNIKPEYPHGDEEPQIEVQPDHYPTQSNDKVLPELQADNPYSSDPSPFGPVEPCYLDAKDSLPVPKVQAYPGKVQGFPDPIMGSYETLEIDGNKCYDRHGRFGPYGYGFSEKDGGIGAGIHDEREGVDLEQYIDHSKIHWGEAQERCVQKNKHRFIDPKDASSGTPPSAKGHIPRTAIVLRIWHKFQWTQELILHMRSMVSELSLLTGGEYQVYFLIHVKDSKLPIWSSDDVYEQVVNETLPEEFRGMGVLWSEKQMELVYYGLQQTLMLNRGIFGVFRSAHFPLQYFAHKHPEIEYFWNWEIDIRFTAHWYALFDSLRSFARKQPRKGLWERNERFYIPSVHGSWGDFIDQVQNATESQMSARPPVWGPNPTDETPILPSDPQPPRSYAEDRYEWGVGEEADLITLSPLFDPANSGWAFRNDITGYKRTETSPPRRTSIVTASRLSRRLLTTMHRETAQFRHTMFDEMWPATVALHHGLKAVYAPHPVFMDRAWPPSAVDATFNAGPNGVSGSSRDSPFFMYNEHNFRGVTWYYNSVFASQLWRRWWGFSVEGHGGVKKEITDEGRMCLPPMLLHPIKGFELVVKK